MTNTSNAGGSQQPFMDTSGPGLLLVDGNSVTRLGTKWGLGVLGFRVEAFADPESALANFNPAIHACVITESLGPEKTGDWVATAIKAISQSTPVIMYSERASSNPQQFDIVIHRPTHLLHLKQRIDALLLSPSEM